MAQACRLEPGVTDFSESCVRSAVVTATTHIELRLPLPCVARAKAHGLADILAHQAGSGARVGAPRRRDHGCRRMREPRHARHPSDEQAYSRENGPLEWATHDPLQARRAKGFERLQMANSPFSRPRPFRRSCLCEACNTEAKTEYAFLGEPGGHARDRSMYREMCKPCHGKMDAWLRRLASFDIKVVRDV